MPNKSSLPAFGNGFLAQLNGEARFARTAAANQHPRLYGFRIFQKLPQIRQFCRTPNQRNGTRIRGEPVQIAVDSGRGSVSGQHKMGVSRNNGVPIAHNLDIDIVMPFNFYVL